MPLWPCSTCSSRQATSVGGFGRRSNLSALGLSGEAVYAEPMKLPVVNQAVSLVIKGRSHRATCMDLFDGGCGYYFDALFAKKTRHKFSAGDQCPMPELGEKCLADFVSYPKNDDRTVRFLISKW